jgi:hypothetical protein
MPRKPDHIYRLISGAILVTTFWATMIVLLTA